MVELENVGYVIGEANILADVSPRFAHGRFNVILGPNGAGKSTMLRIAAGLLTPTSGRILYDGRALDHISTEELARTRAVLSQQVILAFALPVVDVVMMGRYPHYGRVPSARDVDIVHRALEIVGMTERRDQPYPTLSGGERQKVQLARVLAQIWRDEGTGADVATARCLFLDEPTASLDVHYQLHLLDVARDLTRQGCTVVAILHDLNSAFQYGDRFVLLDRGRVVLETDDASDISASMLEEVFRVRARRLKDEEGAMWRFRL